MGQREYPQNAGASCSDYSKDMIYALHITEIMPCIIPGVCSVHNIWHKLSHSLLQGIISILMLGLHRVATNLGLLYELKTSVYHALVSSRNTSIVRSQASIYIDVGERLTYD